MNLVCKRQFFELVQKIKKRKTEGTEKRRSVSVMVECECNVGMGFSECECQKMGWKGTELRNGKWTRFIWILLMEVVDQLRGITQFSSQEPRCFFVGTFITGPSNQIEKLAEASLVIQFQVEDFGDLIFQFTIHQNWWARRLNLIWNGVWRRRLEHGNMENGMDSAYCQADRESKITDLLGL